MKLSVRKANPSDFTSIVDYFRSGSDEFLLGMGVDRAKLLARDHWLELLHEDFSKELSGRKFYYLIWMVDDKPVAHSNINKIIFGEEAYTHLHVWTSAYRGKGIAVPLMKTCLHHYFSLFKLKNIYCEPYALNRGPNKVLEQLGFDLIKEYETIPGWIAFVQPVKRWCMSREKFYNLYKPGEIQEVV